MIDLKANVTSDMTANDLVGRRALVISNSHSNMNWNKIVKLGTEGYIISCNIVSGIENDRSTVMLSLDNGNESQISVQDIYIMPNTAEGFDELLTKIKDLEDELSSKKKFIEDSNTDFFDENLYKAQKIVDKIESLGSSEEKIQLLLGLIMNKK